MNNQLNILGKRIKVSKQKPIYDGDLLCPICELQGEDCDWEQIDGNMRVRCACERCDISYTIWFSLNYVEHNEIEA